jgi:hypothetical protein
VSQSHPLLTSLSVVSFSSTLDDDGRVPSFKPQEPELVTQTSHRPFRRPDIVTIATGHHSRYVATRDALLGNARESLANNKNQDENFFATIVQV